jgi:hypothetical protein
LIIVFASLNSQANVCTSLLAYNGTVNDASGVIQGCINNEPSGGTVELPADMGPAQGLTYVN